MRSLFVILPLVTLGWLATVNTVRAQEVSTDGTLSTTVRLDGSNFIIENGNRAGGNLFHSFSQFSVPNGRSAVFQNPIDVQNIISRVTGGSISNIDGLIRAQGRANLFLLNPAGIAFGPNARLNIGGSFFATTANSLLFGDGVEFSATNLATPPVLTVNIPIGLRFRDNPGNITTNRFVASDGTVSRSFLSVQPGNTLALVGGNVNIDSGILFAPGGRVELGGLTQAGTIGLNPDNSLSFPDGVARGDVAINNGGVSVSTVEGNSGDINIQGKSVSLTNNTQLFASHIRQGNAGNISVKAQDAVRLDNSFIFSDVGNSGGTQSNGNVGNILIEGTNVSLSNGSQLQAGFYSNSQGNPGSVTVRAKESVSLANSSIFTDVLSGTTGNGSNIEIVAGSVSLSDGSRLRARNQGQGNAGNINITATDGSISLTNDARLETGGIRQGNAGNVVLQAQDAVRLDNSFIFSDVGNSGGTRSVGNVGKILIEARNISLSNGSQLQAGFYSNSQGNPGSVTVRAKESVSLANSNIFTDVLSGTIGDGSNIEIVAGSVSLSDGSQLRASNQGQGSAGDITVNAHDSVFLDGGTLRATFSGTSGKAGNINVKTGSLFVRNGGQVSASTFSTGNGGNLTITADTVELTGSTTGLFAQANRGSTGNAGDLTINTQQLFVRDGARISASTFSTGNGGNLTITADTVELIGSSGLFAQADRGSTGNAQNLTINAQKLFVRDRAKVSAGTFGTGNGGNLTVTANTVELTGSTSGLFAQADRGSTGNAGDLTINTQHLFVSDGAGVFVRSLGTGNAGNLKVNARSIKLDNQGRLTASTSSGDGGNITLNVRDYLFMRRNSNITASGGNDGGNIFINNDPGYRGFVIATPMQNSDITANASTGQGGKVIINSYGIFGFVPRSREDSELSSNDFDPSKLPTNDITAISQQSPTLSGTVEINTLDVDPSQGLLELQANLTDPSSQIAQNPCQKGFGSSFIITGRGGLPSSPNDSLSNDNVRVGLVNPSTSSSSSQSSTINQPITQSTGKQIIPAQGWIFNDKGEVVLTAYDPTTTNPQRTSQPTAACPAF
ncbi:filamentous hemagglutinin N-terminal domain-containing protein [Mastigocladus laminosus UU774]|nr:filamentous hemagglutinin N-terminal domain-containing protein [Mastigocladus laminosus UU774]